jgi:hypothetical protein
LAQPGCAGAMSRRFTATAAAAAAPSESPKPRPSAPPAGDVLPNELAEHSAFLEYCRSRSHIHLTGVAPLRTCSTSQHMRLSDACRSVIMAKAAIDAKTAEAAKKLAMESGGDLEPFPSALAGPDALAAITKFDFRSGRGLVATKDYEMGAALLRAPVSSLAINVETLHAEHNETDEGKARYAADEAAAAAFRAIPAPETIHNIVNDMMIRDSFYHHQLLLTTWIAWERCDPRSTITPYLNTLPVPAIDNDVVLTVHAGGLSSLQSSAYLEYNQDFLYALKRIRHSWIDRINRLPIQQELKTRAIDRVPPIQVLDWAWRTVLGRQMPLPPRGLAPNQACFRGSVNRSVNYTQWFELTGQQHLLMPSLAPMFDLLDHRLVPNVEVDVLMRPLKPDNTVDDEAADAFVQVLRKYETLSVKSVRMKKERLVGQRRGGIRDIMRSVNYLKQLADKAQLMIVGATGGTSVPGEPIEDPSDVIKDSAKLSMEKAKAKETVVQQLQRVEEETGRRLAPVVELRTVQPVKAGEQLGVHFSLMHSRPFTLYRFGFEPV